VRHVLSKFTKIALVLLFFIVVCLNAFAENQAVYIWQRTWNNNLKEAIHEINPSAKNFLILSGSFSYKNNTAKLNKVAIDLSSFNPESVSLTLVFRMDAYTAALLNDTKALKKLIEDISPQLLAIIHTAKEYQIAIEGIQIDYDCPTSKISDYANFMKLLKDKFQHFKISFTALPAWLESKDFPTLAATSDYYVLQVHSFKIPDTLDEALKPFSGDQVFLWVKKASFIGHPYYISLPTYGYEVSFDENGKFLGLRAETPQINYKAGTKHAVIMTDPKRILEFLNEIKEKKPEHLLGFCWFRLPLKTDEFNWSIDTLKMVMIRQAPQVLIKNEIVSPSPGLYEVYIINNGQTNLFKDIYFTVMWDKDISVVHDVISGYKEEGLSEGSGIKLIGIPPKVGNKKLVAWFRTGRTDINQLKVGEIEGYEK